MNALQVLAPCIVGPKTNLTSTITLMPHAVGANGFSAATSR